MQVHRIGRADSRTDFSTSEWCDILHPGLARAANLLSKFHKYVYPEWGLRENALPEHGCEALMRLATSEIMAIDDNQDLNIELEPRDLKSLLPKNLRWILNNSEMDRSMVSMVERSSGLKIPSGSTHEPIVTDTPSARTRYAGKLQQNEDVLPSKEVTELIQSPDEHGLVVPSRGLPPRLPRWMSHVTRVQAFSQGTHFYSLATVEVNGKVITSSVKYLSEINILTWRPDRPYIVAAGDIRTSKPNSLAALTWWTPSAATLFHINVRTHILPAPFHPMECQFNLRTASDEAFADWETLRVETFKNLSSSARACLLRPVSGQTLPQDNWPKTLPESGEDQSEEIKKLVNEALENFALVVLEPLEIELVEFAAEPNRKWHWRLSENGWSDVIPL